jgi:hypothetical protein
MARYVAILRSLSGFGAAAPRTKQTSSRVFGSRILLSQVQVFNDMKEEIGKGKKSAGTGIGASFANDGNTIIRDNNIFMDTDSEHDKNIWFIDLDSVNEVRGVKVYNKASDKGVMSNAADFHVCDLCLDFFQSK